MYTLTGYILYVVLDAQKEFKGPVGPISSGYSRGTRGPRGEVLFPLM